MMTPGIGTVERITVDLRRNRLLLHLAEPVGEELRERRCIVDVGVNGRLIGVELEDAYYPIAGAEPGSDALVRSCAATIGVRDGGLVLVLPRRGDDYELSFPSGNQCWQRHGQRYGRLPEPPVPQADGAETSWLCAMVDGSSPAGGRVSNGQAAESRS